MNVPTGEFRALVDDVAEIRQHMAARDELVPMLLDRLLLALRGEVPGDVSNGIPGRPARRRARTSGRPRAHLRAVDGGQP